MPKTKPEYSPGFSQTQFELEGIISEYRSTWKSMRAHDSDQLVFSGDPISTRFDELLVPEWRYADTIRVKDGEEHVDMTGPDRGKYVHRRVRSDLDTLKYLKNQFDVKKKHYLDDRYAYIESRWDKDTADHDAEEWKNDLYLRKTGRIAKDAPLPYLPDQYYLPPPPIVPGKGRQEPIPVHPGGTNDIPFVPGKGRHNNRQPNRSKGDTSDLDDKIKKIQSEIDKLKIERDGSIGDDKDGSSGSDSAEGVRDSYQEKINKLKKTLKGLTDLRKDDYPDPAPAPAPIPAKPPSRSHPDGGLPAIGDEDYPPDLPTSNPDLPTSGPDDGPSGGGEPKSKKDSTSGQAGDSKEGDTSSGVVSAPSLPPGPRPRQPPAAANLKKDQFAAFDRIIGGFFDESGYWRVMKRARESYNNEGLLYNGFTSRLRTL